MNESQKLNYCFKVSNIHLFALISIMISGPLTLLILLGSFSTKTSIVLVLVMLVLIYCFALLFVNRLFIFDDHIEIIFPLRNIFFKRFYTVIIPFDEVSLVKLISKSAKEPPTINFCCKSKYKMVYKSFPVYKFEKRKRILLFLKDKGIQIKIDSLSRRDNQIFAKDFIYKA